MKRGHLDDIPSSGSLLRFSDEICDDLTLKNVSLAICKFVGLGIRDASVEDCSLSQSLFEDCYMRKARFTNVRFTGSTFRNCNLEKAAFSACDFKYCSFDRCLLNRDEIIACLPIEPNLRRDLARNLRKNFESIGDKESSDVLLEIENQSHEEALKAIFLCRTEYYKKRYNLADRLSAGVRYVISKGLGLVWGHGRRVLRLLMSYAVITIILSLWTYSCGVEFSDGHVSVRALSFWESLYVGFAETLGVVNSGFVPITALGRTIQLLECFLGTLFLALLAAAAYRRIAR